MHEMKPFPDAGKYVFKQKFIDRYSKLTDWDVLRKYLLSFLRKSIRVNTLKIKTPELIGRLEKDWILDPVPWCGTGFFIEHKRGRLDVGNTIEHALGYYYVQGAASMLPPIVLQAKPGDVVLDMSAAPGSKTTQLACMMNNEGVLVANDVKGDRIAALGLNLQRCGVSNEIITLMPGQRFENAGARFDRVLLDAPCSGTGTIRKSPKTIRMWNPKSITRMAALQKRLILSAWNVLKSGGVLVYSTCSLEPEENEGVVDFLLEKVDDAVVEDIDLPINSSKPVVDFEDQCFSGEVKKCLRLWPQDNDSEGFFVTKIRKVIK